MSLLRAYRWPLLWVLLVLGLGSIPDVPGPATGLPLDKLAHLLMYGVLGVLLERGWEQAGRRPRPLLLIALGLLAGLADELHQLRVPGRSGEAADWIMDALGVAGGFALGAALRRRPVPEDAND